MTRRADTATPGPAPRHPSRPAAAWPERRALCLECRCTLPSIHSAHTPGHEIVSLRDPLDRAALLERVWGGVRVNSYRLRHWEALAWLCPLLGLAAAVPVAMAVPLADTVPFGVGLGVGFVAQRLCQGRALRVVEERANTSPRLAAPPVLALPAADESAGRRVGTVCPSPTAPTPLGDRPAVAYAISLGGASGDGAVLRDAATIGFAIACDDGETVEIPPGPIDIVDEPARGRRVDVSVSEIRTYYRRLEWADASAIGRAQRAWRAGRMARYLTALDPVRRRDRGPDPFQHQRAVELAIGPGERVVVVGEVERTGLTGGTYRESARQVVRPVGRPRIAVVSATPDAAAHPGEAATKQPDRAPARPATGEVAALPARPELLR